MFFCLKRAGLLDTLKENGKDDAHHRNSEFCWAGKKTKLAAGSRGQKFLTGDIPFIRPNLFFGERRARHETRGGRDGLGERHEEKGRRRDGQEGNRDPPLLERGSGENLRPEAREFGNISVRNPKLYPTYAESDQGAEELPSKMNRQAGRKLQLPHECERIPKNQLIIFASLSIRLLFFLSKNMPIYSLLSRKIFPCGYFSLLYLFCSRLK